MGGTEECGVLDDENECGIVDGGRGDGLNVDGPATAFVCSPFMVTMRIQG